ncbi:methyltransferase [Hirsutella rhossiliensis]|uniref:Methyltransferase domain-containing protein n=1 Tax=Hirsutella rhossiliensis TaxID=111463 RepID=A0A9P8MNY2_9HYPO|nr:methyltransferase domain-containing protein [Hirsutella rhossiliensis]KAH0959668.1 methyltransferase domain-containing protein [Hirsutella rhossiliensis]
MALLTTLQDLVVHLVEPWLFMAISLRHVPQTVRAVVASGQLATLLSPSAFSDALFGQFWATVGPDVKQASEAHVVPLLEGRVSAGRVHRDVVAVPVHGTVVEIGAGSGMWADVFARIRAGSAPPPSSAPGHADDGRGDGPRERKKEPAARITKIYGVEPNPQSAAALARRVQQVGLADIYQVVPVGIESVSDPSAWAGQIPPGSVDCIVGVLCLCSIPDPEDNIRRLHKLLKPGGRWYVYEHVKATRGGLLLRLYQRLVNIPWSFFLGSCRICRSTDKTLRAAGSWQEVDLAQPPSEAPYCVLPHVLGTLTK